MWNLSKNRLFSEEKHAHNLDITDVDYDGHDIIVTGSKDERIKVGLTPRIKLYQYIQKLGFYQVLHIFKKNFQVWYLEDRKLVLKYNVAAEDRVWSVAFQSGSNSLLCYGTSGHQPSKCPLNFFDIER